MAVSLGVGAVRDAVDLDVAQTTAQQQAVPLARVCDADPGAAARAGADCATARTIARDGVDGRDGPAGRGIVGTSVDAGRLVLAFSDGTSQDVGQVIGADGKAGPDGRGITDTAVVAGRLVVTYSDGKTADVGAVVGPAGRGIASVTATEGRLIVTLTDSTVIDVGPLPAGPKGDTGAAAPSVASQTFRHPDGAITTCTRIAGSPDADPEFDCTRTEGTSNGDHSPS